MFWPIVALVACFTLVSLIELALAAHWLKTEARRIQSSLEESIHAFVTQPDADTPAPIASYIDLAATLLTARAIQQLKAMSAGVLSGEAKRAKDEVVAENMANAPGWMGLAASFLPKKVVRQVMSNPQMLGMLGKLGGGNGAGPVSQSGSSTSITTVQDRLKRQQ